MLASTPCAPRPCRRRRSSSSTTAPATALADRRAQEPIRPSVVLDYRDNPGVRRRESTAAAASRAATSCCWSIRTPTLDLALHRAACRRARGPSADVAAVGPKVLVTGDPARICSAGLRVNRVGYACDRGYLELDSGQYDSPAEVLGRERLRVDAARAGRRGSVVRSPPTSSTTRTSICAGASGSPDTGSST